MKGVQALIVAAGLGIVAAILNFLYLFPASQEHEPVYFIAVKQGRTINRGERLKTEADRGGGDSQGSRGQSPGPCGALEWG